jgi:cytochrome b561
MNIIRSYPRASIILHWSMLLLMAATYAAIELRTFFPKGSDIREGFKSWHFMLGLCVLALVTVRIVVRLQTKAPPITPGPPAWQGWAARGAHLALYALMLGMPLAGWAILSASGKPIPFFGLGLPPLIGPDQALASSIKEIHETAGTVGYWLIGLHAAAALAHHYWWKDDTMRRMWPYSRRAVAR